MIILEGGAIYERGSIMFMVLMMFLLVCFLSAAVIEVGVMEFKSSTYEAEAQQAQQAVDAGVDWGLENIYAELATPDNLTIENLPAYLTCGNQVIQLNVDDRTCAAGIGEVIIKSRQEGESGSCVYEFTVTGTYENACQKATVQAAYYFTGGYQSTNPDGSISFIPRQYLNRGDITYYQKAL